MAGAKKYVCRVCNKNVTKNTYSLKCSGDCGEYFHKQCTGLSKKQFEVILKMKKPNWICKDCNDKSEVSVSSGSDSSGASEDEAENQNSRNSVRVRKSHSGKRDSIAKARSEVDEEEDMNLTLNRQNKNKQQLYDLMSKTNPTNSDLMKVLNVKFSEFEKSLTYYGNCLDDLQETVKNLTKENAKLKKGRNDMEGRIQALEKEVKKLNKNNAREEQEVRKHNLVFLGIRTTEANCSEDIQKVLTALNVNIQKQDYKTKLLPSEKPEKPIIVTFKNEETPKTIMENRKKKGTLTVKDCNMGNSNTRIFVNEDLSREQRQIFHGARRLKNQGYKYVWCKGGRIFVRKGDESEIICIRDISQVQSLEQDPAQI